MFLIIILISLIWGFNIPTIKDIRFLRVDKLGKLIVYPNPELDIMIEKEKSLSNTINYSYYFKINNIIYDTTYKNIQRYNDYKSYERNGVAIIVNKRIIFL